MYLARNSYVYGSLVSLPERSGVVFAEQQKRLANRSHGRGTRMTNKDTHSENSSSVNEMRLRLRRRGARSFG